jgi:hypothetical protein
MVKLLVRNERLYLDRAGKETELTSATIYHHKTQDKYQIVVFPDIVKTIKRGKTFIQKGYPLVGIVLKKVEDKHITTGRAYYHLKTKNYYINYYV